MGPDPLTTFLVLVVRGSFRAPGLHVSAWVCYAGSCHRTGDP
nr:MAG TPA: hypothetical protein [Caudoviricetes sp.]